MALRMKRRRGMGQVYSTSGQEVMGPPVDPNQPTPSSDVQQQIADLWDTIFKQQQVQGSATPASSGSFTQWLNANQKTVMFAGVGILAFALFTGGRR